jgi:hypothetical protein
MAAAGVGITAQILSGLIAEALSKGDRDLAEHYLQQAANDGNIPLPDLQKIAAETLGPSAMESVSTDPRLESAQYAALDKLQGISDAGGYTLTDEANLNRILGKTNRAANAQNAAVREDMAARGVGGSGAEVAMQLANNQAQAQRGADEGLDVAAQAQQRALDAIMARGEMGGKMRGQSFDEQAQKAQAKDMIARYNATAKDRANYYNAGLGQQDYENRVGAANRRAAGHRAQAQIAQNRADSTRRMVGGVGNSVAYGAGAVGQYAGSQGGGGQQQGSNPDEWENPYGGY